MLTEKPNVTRFNIGDYVSYYQLNAYYNWAEKHIEALESENQRLKKSNDDAKTAVVNAMKRYLDAEAEVKRLEELRKTCNEDITAREQRHLEIESRLLKAQDVVDRAEKADTIGAKWFRSSTFFKELKDALKGEEAQPNIKIDSPTSVTLPTYPPKSAKIKRGDE